MQDGQFYISPVEIGNVPLVTPGQGPRLDPGRSPEYNAFGNEPPYRLTQPLSPGTLNTDPNLYDDVKIANQSGFTNWWNTLVNSWNDTQIGVGASDLMDGLTKKANFQNQLQQLEADFLTGRVDEMGYLTSKNDIYRELGDAYAAIGKARASMYEDEEDKRSVSKAFKFKTDMAGLTGGDSFLDQIKYQAPTVLGSSGALMIPGLLAAFGQKQVAGMVARGLAGAAIGSSAPGLGTAIGFIAGAGLTLATNLITRNLESKAEVGGQFIQDYDMLKSQYLEDKPYGYQLTEEEDNKLILQAAEGAGQQYNKNMSLALSDTVQAMLIAGTFSKMLGKLGNVNKYTKIGERIGTYYTTRKLEGLEEGLQYAWGTEKTLASLGLKDSRNFFSSLYGDYKDVLSSMQFIGLRGDGVYSKDKQFNASVQAGELLGGLFGGTRAAFDISKDIYGYRSTTKELRTLNPTKVDDPLFKFKNDVYESFFRPKKAGVFGLFSQSDDDRVFYFKEALKTLSRTKTEKGEPLLDKDELRTELESVDRAYSTYKDVYSAVEGIVAPYFKKLKKPTEVAKTEFRKALFNNVMQLERLNPLTQANEHKMMTAMAPLNDISQVRAQLQVVNERLDNSTGNTKVFLEKEQKRLNSLLASVENTYTSLGNSVPRAEPADQQMSLAINLYYDSASKKYDYEQEKKSLSKVKNFQTLNKWVGEHAKIAGPRVLEEIETEENEANKAFATAIGARAAWGTLTDEEKKTRQKENEDIMNRLNFGSDYVQTLTPEQLDKEAEAGLEELKKGVMNVTEDFVLTAILDAKTKDQLEVALSLPSIRAAFTKLGYKLSDDLGVLQGIAEKRLVEIRLQRKDNKIRVAPPVGLEKNNLMTKITGRPKNEGDTRDTIDYLREFNIVDGKAKQRDVLQAIIDSQWATEVEKAQAKQMLEITKDEVIYFHENWRHKEGKPVAVDKDGKPISGDYTDLVRKPGLTVTNPKDGTSTIVMDLVFFGDEIEGNQTVVNDKNQYEKISLSFEASMLHELWHAYTTLAIDRNEALKIQLEEIRQKAIEAAKKEGRKYYGLASVREMVAEAWTSPQFQGLLATVKTTSPGGAKSDGWTEIIRIFADFLKTVFGLEISNTALEDVMLLTQGYIGGKNGTVAIKNELETEITQEYNKIVPTAKGSPLEAAQLYQRMLNKIIKTSNDAKLPENIKDSLIEFLNVKEKQLTKAIENARVDRNTIEFKGKKYQKGVYVAVSGYKVPFYIDSATDEALVVIDSEAVKHGQVNKQFIEQNEQILFEGTKKEVEDYIASLADPVDEEEIEDNGDLYKSVVQEFAPKEKGGKFVETKDPIEIRFNSFIAFLYNHEKLNNLTKLGYRMLLVQDDDAVAGFTIPRSPNSLEDIRQNGAGQIAVITDMNGNPVKFRNNIPDPNGEYIVFNIETPLRIRKKSLKVIMDRYKVTREEAFAIRENVAKNVEKNRALAKEGKPVFMDFVSINPGVQSAIAVTEAAKKPLTREDAARALRIINYLATPDIEKKGLTQQAKDFLFYFLTGKNPGWKISGGKVMFNGVAVANPTEQQILDNFEYMRAIKLAEPNGIYTMFDIQDGKVVATDTFPSYEAYWATMANLEGPITRSRYNGYIMYEFAEQKKDDVKPDTTPTKPDDIKPPPANPFPDKMFDELSTEDSDIPPIYNNELGLFDNRTTNDLIDSIDFHIHAYARENGVTFIHASEDLDFINKILAYTQPSLIRRLTLLKEDKDKQLAAGAISQIYHEAKVKQIDDQIQKINENWNDIKKYYLKNSNVFTFGADISYKYDEDGNIVTSDDDRDVARDKGFDKEGNRISPIDGAAKEIKALIRGLPRYKNVEGKWKKVTNAFNVPSLGNFAVTWNNLIRNLQNTNDVEEMMTKMEGLTSRFPEYVDLLDILKKYFEKSLNSETDSMLMISKFETSFINPEIPIMQNIMSIEGDKTIFKTSEATRRNIDDLRKQALDNFRYKSAFSVKDAQGNRVLDPQVVLMPIDTKDQRVAFLKALGFPLSAETIADKEFNTRASRAIMVDFQKALTDILEHVTAIKDPLRILGHPTAYNPGWRKRITDILELESKYTITSPTLSMINADGNIEYAISRPNGFSVVVRAINSAKTFQELTNRPEFSFLNRPYARTSAMLNQIFVLDSKKNYGARRMVDNKPVMLSLLNISGLDIENGEGHKTTSLFIGDKIVSDFDQFLKTGSKEFMRAGDKSSAFGAKISTWIQENEDGVKGNLPISNFALFKDSFWNVEMERIFTKYLTGEVARMILGQQGNFENLRKVNEASKNPSLFFSLLPDATKAQMKEEIRKFTLLEPNSDALYAEAEIMAKNYITKVEVVKHIEEFFQKEYKAKRDSLNKYGFLLKDPYWVDETLKPHGTAALLRSYLVNEFIFHVEQTKLFNGDLVFYTSRDGEVHKRFPSMGATGLIPTTGRWFVQAMNNHPLTNLQAKNLGVNNVYSNIVKTVVFRESQPKNQSYIDSWGASLASLGVSQERINEILAEYKKGSKEADAQGWITMDYYRSFKLSIGDWRMPQERVYEKLSRGEALSQDEVENFGAVFPPIKAQYAGPIYNAVYHVPAFHKFSLLPLIPSAIKGTDMELLNERMIRNNIGYALMETGSKIGTEGAILEPFYNEHGQMTDPTLPFLNENIIFTNFLKEQVQIEPELHKEVIFGTQFRKLLFSNIFDSGKPVNKVLAALYDQYRDAINELTGYEQKKLIDSMGIKPIFNDDGELTDFKVEDQTKLIQRIKEEITRRKLNNAVKDFFEFENGKLKYDLDASINHQQIRTLVMSMINNKLIRQTMTGDLAVQASGIGFGKFRKPTKEEELEYGTRGLRFYYVKNGKVRAMQIKTSLTGDFKYLLNLEHNGQVIGTRENLNKALKDEQWMDANRKLVTMVGYRIPTQGLNSMEVMEVAEFLPAEAGSVLIVPPEIVVKSGSDFDIDKLSIFRPSLSRRGELIERTKFRSITTKSIEDIQPMIDDLQAQKKSYEHFEKMNKAQQEKWINNITEGLYDVTNLNVPQEKKEELAQIGITIQELRERMAGVDAKIKDLTNQLDYNPDTEIYEELVALRFEQTTVKLEIAGELERKQEIQRNLIVGVAGTENLDKMEKFLNELYDKLLFGENDFNERINGQINSLVNEREIKLREIRQYKAGLHNTIIDLATQRLTDLSSFEQLITPNSPDLVKNVVNEIAAKDPTKKPYMHTNNLTSSTQEEKFLAGIPNKKALGIAAVANVMSQLFNKVGLDINTMYGRRPTWHPMIEGRDFSSLLLANKITKSEIESQMINAYVDVLNDDFISRANLSKDTAGAFFYLLHLGHDHEQLLYFFNHPVIKKYTVEVQKNKSAIRKLRAKQAAEALDQEARELGQPAPFDDMEKYLNKRAKIEAISFTTGTWIDDPYKFQQENVAAAHNHLGLFSKEHLKSVANTSLDKIDGAQKRSILAYYLNVIEESNDLLKLQLTNNYDTSTSVNPVAHELREAIKSELLEKNLFSTINITKGTVVESFNQFSLIGRILDALMPVTLNSEVRRTIVALVTFLKGVDEDKLTRTFINDWLAFIAFNFGEHAGMNYGQYGRGLLIGQNQLYHKLLEFKLDDKWANLRSDFPVINTLNADVQGAVGNISLYREDNSVEYQNAVIEQFQKLAEFKEDGYTEEDTMEIQQFFKDLMVLGFAQSGLNKSPISFSDLIPNEYYAPMMTEALAKYKGLSKEEQNQVFLTYYTMFRDLNPQLTGQKFQEIRYWRYKDYNTNLVAQTLVIDQTVTGTVTFEADPSSNYMGRTNRNASADATIAIAVDFTTGGEVRTKESVEKQGKQYIPIAYKGRKAPSQTLVDQVVDLLNKASAKTLNIAGNGIYTMKGEFTQEQVDEYTYNLIKAVTQSPRLKNRIELIRTGGQTGFDEAGGKAGIRLGIPTLILAPKGWKFRTLEGTDVSDEKAFKDRFNVTPDESKPLTEFDIADKLSPIEQNYKDGSGGRTMQEQHRGKSTMQLIKEGIRTRTTRAKTDIARMVQDYGLSKISELIGKVIRMTDKQGNQVYTRITNVAHFTQEYQDQTWEREGWTKNVTDELVGKYPYAIEFEVVDRTTGIKTGKVTRTTRKIMRAEVQANKNTLYLFGDNDLRTGLGGQAKEMRGEPNAVGISTKKAPSDNEDAFKRDDEYEQNAAIITADINRAIETFRLGKYDRVVIPQIGVGLAKLPEYAPRTYAFLQAEFDRLEAAVNNPQPPQAGEQLSIFDEMSIEDGEYIFEQNPKLAGIGSVADYGEYLKTIFPESLTTNVAYRANDKGEINTSSPYSGGIWFADTPKNVTNFLKAMTRPLTQPKGAILDMRNPKVFERFWNDYVHEAENLLDDYGRLYREQFKMQLQLAGYDSFVIGDEYTTWSDTGETMDDFAIGRQWVVFKPEQIHILGTEQDIQGFKNYMEATEQLQHTPIEEGTYQGLLQNLRDDGLITTHCE